MNIPNLQRLADDLRAKSQDQFHLGFWFGRAVLLNDLVTPACQTCACIAGDALMLFAPDKPVLLGDVAFRARKHLGLNTRQAQDLFNPLRCYDAGDQQSYQIPAGRSYVSITPQEAAKVIDHLIATGEVDWRIVSPK